jgi:putative hydrolase of the HAD superfamily
LSITVMTIKAVVFDIGGVLEITPRLGVSEAWGSRLGLAPGELDERMADAWHGGGIGTVSERGVHQALSERLGLNEQQVSDFMADLWREYLGTANTELIEYAGGLRPRYRTGILSNSFVGAREREQAAYGFEDLVDEMVYSHESGMSKPDPAIYALACERLRVSPPQVVFLDDYEPYVAGARLAGMHAVLYRDNAQAIGDVEKLLAPLRADHAVFRHDRRDQVGRSDVEGVVERAGSLGRHPHAREGGDLIIRSQLDGDARPGGGCLVDGGLGGGDHERDARPVRGEGE